MLLNSPFEIEFPVFQLFQEGGFDAGSFGRRLASAGTGSARRLDDLDSAYAGLSCFSVDLNAGKGLNDKWRFYLDEARNEICFVAMPEMFPGAPAERGNGDTLWRLSWQFAMASFAPLRDSLGMREMELIEQEERLAFGSVHDFRQIDRPEFQTFLARQRNRTGDFYNQYCENGGFRAWAGENSSDNLADCMIRFFQKLGDDLKFDGGWEWASADYDPYERLLQGPSFADLTRVMDEIWRPGRPLAAEERHSALSGVLDQQIDQGFIVPALSRQGGRIFRKGEPWPWVRSDAEIARCLGLSEDAVANWNIWEENVPADLVDEFSAMRTDLSGLEL